MARPAGGSTVHVGKAAVLIVVGVLVGIIVLRSDGSSGTSLSAAAAREAAENALTNTTLDDDDDDVTATTVALRAPASVKVIAINGTRTAGQGAKATTKLQNALYNAVAPGNATEAVRATNPASVIYVVTPGYEREAAAVAAVLGLPASAVRSLPSPSPSPDIKGDVNIAVLIGSGITL